MFWIRASVNVWHRLLTETIRNIGFEVTRLDSDVWMGCNGFGGYNHLGAHTDNVMCVSKDAEAVMDQIKEIYVMKKVAEPEYHLGCDYEQVTHKNTTFCMKSCGTYIKEALTKVADIVGKTVKDLRIEFTLKVLKDKPELDSSPLLKEHNHRLYQQLIGIGIWLGQIGRIDITHAVSSLSRFSVAPSEGHLSRIEKVYGYLKNWNLA